MAVRADNRLDDAPMAPVTCARCGAGVEVRKSSWNQTSVQWTGAALGRCEERCTAARLAGDSGNGLFLACSALGVSIVDAVRSGALQVVDETS
ncbi:ferredoxin [Mycolicibacterium sp. (ex Dasyatis americana)]|uniref:ferredoxin n=1 Tax=Mycobacterium sp. DBP42 TaxID=2545267 RepID=UPI000872C4FC|nr:ferredoxin [Mycobacterium sp. DBP42]OFB37825.1 ferredoxin [Mycolicibacterium sp. (ex Dasyatis americana)]TMS51473.1 ferredoxin [Mycobacterium sp. DBP42]